MKYKESLETLLTNEVVRIGDMLLNEAKTEFNGIYWETISLNNIDKNRETYAKEYNLYKGVSGICLFLVELHIVTNEKKYLEAAEQGMHWVVNSKLFSEDNSYSLFTGRMGVAIVQLRLYEVTSNQLYLEQALTIAKESFSFNWCSLYELINGLSGCLLALIHIHAATQNEEVLKLIEIYTEKLILSMKSVDKGLFWDTSSAQTSSLCGLSHGVSGIAYVFLELGYYLGNNTFYEFSFQAFIYENQHYDINKQNWLDLRNTIDEQTHPAEYLEAYDRGDSRMFFQTDQMNAWCHGAAGIGLSRALAYERIPKAGIYLQDFFRAINKTIYTNVLNDDLRSPTLCHGSGGNADLFIEAFSLFKEERYLKYAQKVALKILEKKSETGFYLSGTPYEVEDLSLFLGTSGVGHFFLRILTLGKTPSILALKVKTKITNSPIENNSVLRLDLINYKISFFKINFIRTYTILNALNEDSMIKFLNDLNDPLEYYTDWNKFVMNSIKTTKKGKLVLQESYNFEVLKITLNKLIGSNSLIAYKKKMILMDAERINNNSDSSFLKRKLTIDNNIILIATKWNWDISNVNYWKHNLNLKPNKFYYLTIPTHKGTNDWLISEFSKKILHLFEFTVFVNDVVKTLKEDIDFEGNSSDILETIIIEQIKVMINAGWLIDPERHIINDRKLPFLNKL